MRLEVEPRPKDVSIQNKIAGRSPSLHVCGDKSSFGRSRQVDVSGYGLAEHVAPPGGEKVFVEQVDFQSTGGFRPLSSCSGQSAAPGSDFVTLERYCKPEFSAILAFRASPPWNRTLTSSGHRQRKNTPPEFTSCASFLPPRECGPWRGRIRFRIYRPAFRPGGSIAFVACCPASPPQADAATRNDPRNARDFKCVSRPVVAGPSRCCSASAYAPQHRDSSRPMTPAQRAKESWHY